MISEVAGWGCLRKWGTEVAAGPGGVSEVEEGGGVSEAAEEDAGWPLLSPLSVLGGCDAGQLFTVRSRPLFGETAHTERDNKQTAPSPPPASINGRPRENPPLAYRPRPPPPPTAHRPRPPPAADHRWEKTRAGSIIHLKWCATRLICRP